ncbi:MAG: NB-ARC domain-containing protein [Anaerolineae bacterium]|nr:NB-ARC domain-containing protein [Anaerolineae bacterium]
MRLRRNRFEEVRDALLDAYNPDTFASLVRIKLGVILSHISSGANFTVDVEKTMAWCEEGDRVTEFVRGASSHVPTNRRLKAVADALDETWFEAVGASSNIQVFEVDFVRNPQFRGRQNDLEKLHRLLQMEADSDSRAVALSGMGGIGKTQLAVEYAYCNRACYDGGIVWLDDADPSRSLRQQLLDMARLLQLSVADPQRADIEEQLLAALHDHLRTRRETLLIYDNVIDPQAFIQTQVGAGKTPTTLGGKVVIITRRQNIPHPVTCLDLHEVTLETAREIVTSVRPELTTDPALDDLCEMLGYLPLALRLAATALYANPTASIVDYMAALREFGADRLHREANITLTDYYANSLTPALEAQWASVAHDETARQLFVLLGQLAVTTPIPIARLELLSAIPNTGWIKKLTNAVNALEQASLIERVDAERVRMQPLVKEFAQRQLSAEQAAELRKACVRRLLEVYEDAQQLENHCFTRGFYAVERDLVTLRPLLDLDLGFDNEAKALNHRETRLWQLLQREAHTLVPAIGANDKHRFRQQLYLRARLSDYEVFAATLADMLAASEAAYWEVNWVGRQESSGLQRILTGHLRDVNAVAVFADGTRAISAAADKTLRIWDLTFGDLIYALYMESSRFFTVNVAADKYAFGGMADGTITKWHLETHALERIWHGHSRAVNALALFADSERMISASSDTTLKVWHLEQEQPLFTLSGHTGWVRDVVLTPDDRYAISAGADGQIIVWDLEQQSIVRHLHGHRSEVLALALAPDGSLLASSSADKTICIWDWKNDAELKRLIGHRDWVNDVAFLDEQMLASASGDRTIKVWDVATGTASRTLRGHDYRVKAIAPFDNGKQLLSGSADNTVRIWRLDPVADTPVQDGHRGIITAITVNDSHAIVYTAAEDCSVKAWNIANGQLLQTFLGARKAIHALDYNPKNDQIVAGSQDRTVYIWDATSGELLHKLRGHGGGVQTVLVDDNGTVISGGADHRVIIWDVAGNAPHRSYKLHDDWINEIVQYDAVLFASASGDNTINVWHRESGDVTATLVGHEQWVLSVDVLVGEARLISSSNDRSIRVWHVETQAEQLRLTGHDERVTCVRAFADGKRAISTSADNTLRVWNLETANLAAQLDLGSELNAVVVAKHPESSSWYVITGDVAGTVYGLILHNRNA